VLAFYETQQSEEAASASAATRITMAEASDEEAEEKENLGGRGRDEESMCVEERAEGVI